MLRIPWTVYNKVLRRIGTTKKLNRKKQLKFRRTTKKVVKFNTHKKQRKTISNLLHKFVQTDEGTTTRKRKKVKKKNLQRAIKTRHIKIEILISS